MLFPNSDNYWLIIAMAGSKTNRHARFIFNNSIL